MGEFDFILGGSGVFMVFVWKIRRKEEKIVGGVVEGKGELERHKIRYRFSDGGANFFTQTAHAIRLGSYNQRHPPLFRFC